MNPPDTTLTAFFKLCSEDNFAKTLLYSEVPTYYTWNKLKKKFNRRKNGITVENQDEIRKSNVIGRVYTVQCTSK